MFPAYAGMIPWMNSVNGQVVGVPRIRGDDPVAQVYEFDEM